jgi:prepilin-type N-terminal cleavage/methylation domain-containing protein
MGKREGKKITLTLRIKKAGFTLIEIAAVIFVLSSFLLIVLPSFRNIFPRTHLLSSGRRIAGEINRLYYETVFTGRSGSLSLAFDSGEYWSDRESPEGGMEDRGAVPKKLLPGVSFRDVAVAGRKVIEGSAHIDFSPYGLVEPSVIHLVNSDGDELSIMINAFTGKVKIHDGYVEEKVDVQ